MHQPPQGESIWGNINTAFEIAIDIYMIIAKDENGIEHTGIMARKSTAEKNLSPRAVSMAEEDAESLCGGDWLCYDENTKDIPMYEVLQRRVAACKRLETAALKEMEEIKRDGKLTLTDYFGECSPPTQSQQGIINDMLKVRNGLYFTHDNKGLQFAVHEAIADNYMSPMAAEFGHRQDSYLFYDTTTSAIPLNELKNVFDEAEGLIVSEDSLYATLNKNFAAYTMLYNEIMQEAYKIPEIDAPANLFLAVQLEIAKQEQSAAERETPELQTVQDAEPDFSEDSDFEIGQ